MRNTTLPEQITAEVTETLVADALQTHKAVNLLSRDTLRRNLSTYLINGWKLDAGGFIHIRRRDDHVTLIIKGLDGSAATSNAFMQFRNDGAGPSTNFQPSEDRLSPKFRISGAPSEDWWIAAQGTVLNAASLTGAAVIKTGAIAAEITWTTEKAWPTVLPPAV
jgi:hypothetical protein